MARNKLTDLNNHLFAQLERLSDEEIKGEELQQEFERAKAIGVISKQIIDNSKLTLDVMKFSENNLAGNRSMPSQLRLEE